MMQESFDLYDILRVDPGASFEEIEGTFQKRVKVTWRTDEKLQRLASAYKTLIDPESRRVYDLERPNRLTVSGQLDKVFASSERFNSPDNTWSILKPNGWAIEIVGAEKFLGVNLPLTMDDIRGSGEYGLYFMDEGDTEILFAGMIYAALELSIQKYDVKDIPFGKHSLPSGLFPWVKAGDSIEHWSQFILKELRPTSLTYWRPVNSTDGFHPSVSACPTYVTEFRGSEKSQAKSEYQMHLLTRDYAFVVSGSLGGGGGSPMNIPGSGTGRHPSCQN